MRERHENDVDEKIVKLDTFPYQAGSTVLKQMIQDSKVNDEFPAR